MEVFFSFFLLALSKALLAKGKEGTNKKKLFKPFLCELDGKDKNFITLLPKLLRSFFCSLFKPHYAFASCQVTKAFFSWKAGAKVGPFKI